MKADIDEEIFRTYDKHWLIYGIEKKLIYNRVADKAPWDLWFFWKWKIVFPFTKILWKIIPKFEYKKYET